jgi:hypothetical protein
MPHRAEKVLGVILHRSTTRGRHNHPWTAEADLELTERLARGELLPDIARALERSQEAVRARANRLNLAIRSSPGRGRRRILPRTGGTEDVGGASL